MPLTLTIPLLQEHNVCSSGQHNFRRNFGRAKTWPSVELFAADLSAHAGLWDEACDKFDIDKAQWKSDISALGRAQAQTDYEEDEDSDERRAQWMAQAWAHLYWAKMHPSAQAAVIIRARDYVAATDELTRVRLFAANRKSLCEVDLDPA